MVSGGRCSQCGVTMTEIKPGSEIATLRTDLTLIQAEADFRRELVDAKFTASAKALDVALAASDKRLDVMNEVRQTNTDLVQRMMTRSEVQAELSALRIKVELIDKPNYVLWTSLITAALICVGGLWTVTGLKIDNAISPLAISQEQFRSNMQSQERDIITNGAQIRDILLAQQIDTARDSVSIADRVQLNERIKSTELLAVSRNETAQNMFSDIRTMITRLNVWADFLQAKVFPTVPAPPQKQP